MDYYRGIAVLIMGVFDLSKPVSDSTSKPVSVCVCKCCERFGAVALATRVTTFSFPQKR